MNSIALTLTACCAILGMAATQRVAYQGPGNAWSADAATPVQQHAPQVPFLQQHPNYLTYYHTIILIKLRTHAASVSLLWECWRLSLSPLGTTALTRRLPCPLQFFQTASYHQAAVQQQAPYQHSYAPQQPAWHQQYQTYHQQPQQQAGYAEHHHHHHPQQVRTCYMASYEGRQSSFRHVEA